MNPFRCSNCNKLLGMIEGKAEIKCPKCKTVNNGITLSAWMDEHAANNPPGLRIPHTADGIIRDFGRSPIEGLIAVQLYQNGRITREEFEETLGISKLCEKPDLYKK